MRFDTLKGESPTKNVDKFGFLKDNPAQTAAPIEPTKEEMPAWLSTLSRSRGGGVYIPTPQESEEFSKTALKVLDYTVKAQKATSAAIYYTSAENAKRVSPLIPSFGGKTKELPVTSLTDAIKKGWTGEFRVSPMQWVPGLFMDPREIEAIREDWETGWQKWPMRIGDFISEIAVSTIGWTGAARAAGGIKKLYTLEKIKTDKNFVQNTGAAIKGFINNKTISDSDAAILAIHRKTGEAPLGNIVEPRRTDETLIKKLNDEQQNLIYQRTHLDELYTNTIVEKARVDTIPEPEHIGDQKIVIQTGQVVKGAGKSKPVTTERISMGERPIEHAQFETEIPAGKNKPVIAEVRLTKNLGYEITNVVGQQDKFRLIDDSIVSVAPINAGMINHEGAVMIEGGNFADIGAIKSVIKPDGTEILITNKDVRVPSKWATDLYKKIPSGMVAKMESEGIIGPLTEKTIREVFGRESQIDNIPLRVVEPEVVTPVAENQIIQTTLYDYDKLMKKYEGVPDQMGSQRSLTMSVADLLKEKNYPQTKIDKMLDNVGLRRMKVTPNTEKSFSYELHNMVGADVSDQKPGTILKVIKDGYIDEVGGKVIRKASVIVAREKMPGEKILPKIPSGGGKKVSDLADFVVGKQSDWDKLSADKRVAESKLKERIARNAQNEPYQPLETRNKPIPTGSEAILQRLRLEQNFGNIPRSQVDTISRFIDDIGEDLFDDVGLSIRKKSPNGQGQFEYGQSLITLFKDNIIKSGGRFDRATVHEIWHSLARYLPEDDVARVLNQFEKEKAAYIWDTGDTLKTFNSRSYRFKNVDEWFAETLTDKTFERLALMDSSVRNIFIHAAGIVRKIIQGIQRAFGYDRASGIINDFFKQKNTEMIRTGTLEREKGVSYLKDNEALDYMVHEANKKKVDADINDANAAQAKINKETIEEQKVRLELEIKNAERNIELAKQGRLFLTPESESRAIREEYVRAYMSAFGKEYVKPPTTTKQAEINKLFHERAERQMAGEYIFTKAKVKKGETPYYKTTAQEGARQRFSQTVGDLTHQVSNGRTTDIAALTNEEFASVFDAIDMFSSMGGAKFAMDRHLFLEWFNSTWHYFERLGATGVYESINGPGMELMRKSHQWIRGWNAVLKNAGITPKRSLDKLGIPNEADIVARGETADKLGRIMLEADGHSPYDGTNIFDEHLTTDELAFIAETMDGVRSGKITRAQIKAEKEAAQYARSVMDELAEMGERQGYLYNPHTTAKESIPKGAVPRRSNYMRHQIRQILDDLENSAAAKEDYNVEFSKKFFRQPAGETIDIPEMIVRHDKREGLVRNADTALRTVIMHEGFKFYMEPGIKAAKDLAKQIDDIHGIDPTADKSISRYTNEWIKTAIRGQMTKTEAAIEGVLQNKRPEAVRAAFRRAELAGYHGVGKVVNLIRKTLGREPHEFNWEPTRYERAFKTFTTRYRSYVYTTAMGLNPISILKNATQTLLVSPLIGPRATLEGLKSVWFGGASITGKKPNVLNHSNVYFARGIAIHELEMSNLGKISQAMAWPFRFLDQYMNCASAFNGSMWKQVYKDKSKLDILKNYGYTGKGSGKSFWESMNKALEFGEFRGEVKIADMVTKRTQFSYVPWDMPKALWSPVGKVAFQFASWPMNYWTQYMPYLTRMMVTGVGPFGRLSTWERTALLKHLVVMEAAAMSAEEAGVDMSYISPTHAIYKSVRGTGTVLSGRKLPGETYQQGPYPSLPPAFNSIKLLMEEYGMATSGRASKLQAILAPGKSAFMMDPFAKPGEWTGYLPGSLPKTVAKVVKGKKSPLAFAGITPMSERRVRR